MLYIDRFYWKLIVEWGAFLSVRLRNGIIQALTTYSSITYHFFLDNNQGVMHQTAFGMDLVTQHIRCGCGLEPDFFVSGGTYEPNGSYYAKMILCDDPGRKGVLRNLTLHGLADSIRSVLPDEMKSYLTAASLVVQPGTVVSGGEGKHPRPILAALVAHGDNIADALDKANKVHYYASKLVNNCIICEESSKSSFNPSTDENIRFKRR
jgi:hypothetical protein